MQHRWWVRVWARWLARIDGVSGQLNLFFTALTGVSVASGALKYFGLAQYVPYFLGVTGVGALAYAYAFNEFDIRNQTGRDNTDLSTNYSGPTMLMDARLRARQLAPIYAALQNGDGGDPEDVEQRLLEVTREEWAELRDGVPVEQLEEQYR